MTDFTPLYINAARGKTKSLHFKSTPSADADYVDTSTSSTTEEMISLPGGKVVFGYAQNHRNFSKLEIHPDKIYCFLISSGKSYIKVDFKQKLINKFWYNCNKRAFGFVYNSTVKSIPPEDFNSGGVSFQFDKSCKASIFKRMTDLIKIEAIAEKDNFTDVQCNVPWEIFDPIKFAEQAKEKKNTPKKRYLKTITDDEDDEEEEPPKVQMHKKKLNDNPKDRTVLSPEEEDRDEAVEQTKVVQQKKKKKQELSDTEFAPEKSSDESDTEIIKKNFTIVTRSQSASKPREDEDRVLLKKYNIDITVRDISRLEPEEFLNDNIIDFYISDLNNKFMDEKAERVKNDFYIFNTHFHPLLKRDVSRAATKIAKNVKIFEKKLVFIPICEHVHWSLIVICNPNGKLVKPDKKDPNKKFPPDARMIMYCDSLGGVIPTTITKRVRDFLTKRYAFEYPDSNSSFSADNFPATKANLPKQDNHCDCGVFMIHYIEMMIRHEIDSLPIDNIDFFRAEDIPEKRRHIKTLIEYEIQQQEHMAQPPHDPSFNSQSDSILMASQLSALENIHKELQENNQTESELPDEDLFRDEILKRDDESDE